MSQFMAFPFGMIRISAAANEHVCHALEVVAGEPPCEEEEVIITFKFFSTSGSVETGSAGEIVGARSFGQIRNLSPGVKASWPL
jgi:hypothetical protein